MKNITIIGFISLVLCLVVVISVAATPVTSVDEIKKSNISFTKIVPSTDNSRFQSYFQPTAMTQKFNVDDNNKTFTVSRGQIVMVQLYSNPSTGFQWVPSVSSGISIIKDSFQTSVNNRFATGGPIVGAGGVRTWTLKMNNTGNQQFSAEYKQVWMPNSARNYIIHFMVV